MAAILFSLIQTRIFYLYFSEEAQGKTTEPFRSSSLLEIFKRRMNLRKDFEETISMCDITKWGLKMIIQHSPSTGSHSYQILTFSPWHQHSHQIRIALCLLRRNTNFTEKPNTWVTSQLFKLFNNHRKKYTHTEWHTSSIYLVGAE